MCTLIVNILTRYQFSLRGVGYGEIFKKYSNVRFYGHLFLYNKVKGEIMENNMELENKNDKTKREISSYKNFLFIDFETTGLNVSKDKIIMFSYILTNNKMQIERQDDIFINTDNSGISQEISLLTKISQKDVLGGKNSEFLINLLKSIINKDTLIVSYNLSFSMSFLSAFLEKNNAVDILTNVNGLDLLEVFLENKKDVKSHSLKSAIISFRLDVEYNEFNFCSVCLELFKRMRCECDLTLFVK